MFPGWQDPSFRHFFWLVFTFLIGGGLFLLGLRAHPDTRNRVERAWISYRPWLIMAPLAFFTVGLGAKGFIFALFVLSIFCIKEFAKATGLYEKWSFMGVLYVGTFMIYFSVWIKWWGLFIAMPVYVIVALFMVPTLLNDFQNMIQKVGLSTIALVYLAWFPAQLAFLSYHPASFAYLLFLLVGTELNDIAAFTTGKLFGKRPLVPNISPNKTVEGALGAIVIVSLYVLFVRHWVPSFTPFLFGLSVVLFTIGGIFGDLVMSFVKRDIGIKDMGVIIPGHGGLLDRVDSLLFVSPLYFHLINYFIKFPGGLR